MRVHFSTDDLPPRDREEFFVDLVAKYVMSMIACDSTDPTGYRAQFDAYVAGRFTLFGYETPYRTGLRTAANISRDRTDSFRLQRLPRECISLSTTTRATTVEIRIAAGISLSAPYVAVELTRLPNPESRPAR